MTAPHDGLCRHCMLPVGLRGLRRTIDGENRTYCCYGCCIADQVKGGRTEEWEAAWLLIRLGVGSFLSMNIMLFSLVTYAGAFTGADAHMLPYINILMWALATPAVIILGGPFLRETVQHALQGRLSSSALIVLGVGAAYLYSAFVVIEGGAHVYFDTASMVLMLFTAGRYLEAAGRARAARDLHPLLAAESEWATVVEGEAETRRPAREVAAGELVRVRPGERIPIDGVVVEGESCTDEAVMTGESRQIVKTAGAAVVAGSINLDGPLLIRSSGAGNDSRWAQICRAVRAALTQRSPTQRIADVVVSAFVPLVVGVGALTVFYWAQHAPFDRALFIGLAVLVVACPCAVGLAAPLATSLGIGRLARRGCLVRDPGVLETLAQTHVFAFDKTGTLTEGKPRLVAIESDAPHTAELLARAAGLERHCEHALAQAIVAAAQRRGLEPVAVSEVRVQPGRGVRGGAGAEAIAAGSAAFMRDLGWPLSPALAHRAATLEASGYSMVYVGWGDRVQGVLALDDALLADARPTLAALRERGFAVTLLSGDIAPTARRVADAVGIDAMQAGLSPEQKRGDIERRRARGEVVAMVGDGLNDGPVLAAANVGIAVGSATDLARETAALVLPKDGLWLLPWVVDVARAVRRIILGNLAWAFGYNLVALTLAAVGWLRPISAAAVMAGSSILVVLNSLRLERLGEPVPFAAPRPSRLSQLDPERDGANIVGAPPLHSGERALSA